MATKVQVGKLQVSVTEAVKVNGVEHVYNNVYSVAGINTTAHRIIRVPTSAQTNLITFANSGTTGSAGTYVAGDIKYIRVTNLDDTNYVTLQLIDASADTAYFKLAAGQTMVFYDNKLEVKADGSAFAAFASLDNIAAQANTAAVDVEYFVASKQS